MQTELGWDTYRFYHVARATRDHACVPTVPTVPTVPDLAFFDSIALFTISEADPP